MTGKNINVGQYISPGAALGKVETISPIYAVIDIRESDLNYVKLGVSAKLKLNTEGNYYIFIDNNGVAKKQNITIGEFDKDDIEIKSGVQTGDDVICTNVSSLQDGDAVKMVSE